MNMMNDYYNILLICGGLAFILIVLSLLLSAFSRRKKNKGVIVDKDLTDFLVSKIDKIERNINDVKSNYTRWQEFAELELKEIKKSLNDIKKDYSDNNKLNNIDTCLSTEQDIITSQDDLNKDDSIFDTKPLEVTSTSSKSGFNNTTDTFDLSEIAKKKLAEEKLVEDGLPLSNYNSDENETISFEDKNISLKKKHSIQNEVVLSSTNSIASGLSRTRESFFSKIKLIFSNKSLLDNDAFDELEAILFSTDMGTALTSKLIDELKSDVAKGAKIDEKELLIKVKEKIKDILLYKNKVTLDEYDIKNAKPYVIMVVGVNGAGKTTTIAKLANTYKSHGKRVLIAAADTFRAAATEQLQSWGKMLNIPIIAGEEGVKPGTVAFDAMQKAANENYDILLIDTAGRLQSQVNLMQELSGVTNLIKRLNPQAPHEVILVLDGTTGQNALLQAEKFREVVPVTSVAVTKLDGTPKGGIVVAIKSEFGIPIKFIGVGEGKDDLKVFDPNEFVEALFDINN